MTDRLPLRRSAALCWCGAGAIVVGVLLAYANSFPGAFFFDDDAAILQNASIRDLHSWQVLWPPVEAGIGGRPFANLTFALNYLVGHYNPAGYHAVNLAIHLLAALVLYGVTRRTLLQPLMRDRFGAAATFLAAAVGLIWALHPLQTNIVDYMSQRTEGLMALLYLITLYAYIRSLEAGDGAAERNPPGGARSATFWTVLATAAATLGMATKEDMVTVPVIVLLWDRTFRSGSFGAAVRRHWRPILAIAATWLVLAGLMLTSKLSARGVGFKLASPYEYALTETRSIVQYLHLSVWPHPLVFDYGTEFYLRHLNDAAPTLAMVVVIIALTLVALRRWPAVGFASTWFLLLLSPSSSVVPVAQQPCAENRVYLPLVGVVGLICVAAYRYIGRRVLPALAVAAVALGMATQVRNPAFRSELAIWWNTAIRRPGNARAQNNLGNALLKADRVADAKRYFEAAIRLSPTYADAHNNLGVIFLREQRPAEALAEFKRATELKDNYADAFYNQGEAYLQLHRNADAIPPLRTALTINPNNAKAHNNLGIALLELGNVSDSIAEERRSIELDPAMPEAHYNLANSLSRAGKKDEALAEYDATLRINPKFSRAHNNAGVILLDQGRREEARKRFEAALAIDPNYPEARRNLQLTLAPAHVASIPAEARAKNDTGNSLLKEGRLADAKADFEAALKLAPQFAEAHNNLGVVLLRENRPDAALNEFRRATELNPDYADGFYNQGEALLQEHRDADAVPPLRTAVAINPNDPKAHNNLGLALTNLGQISEGITEARKAVQLNPSLPEVHYNLANALAKAGQNQEALAEYGATLRVNPRFAQAHNNAGVILLNEGRRDEARRRFEAALQIDPNYPEAKQNLALVETKPAPAPTKTVSPR